MPACYPPHPTWRPLWLKGAKSAALFREGEYADSLTSQDTLIGWDKGDPACGEGRGSLKGPGWSTGHLGPDRLQLLGAT